MPRSERKLRINQRATRCEIGSRRFLSYLELRLRLLGLESKEAGLHLLVLALLFAGTVVLFAGFLVMSDGIFCSTL